MINTLQQDSVLTTKRLAKKINLSKIDQVPYTLQFTLSPQHFSRKTQHVSAPRAIRTILKNTRNKSSGANSSQNTLKENASSQGQIYATPCSSQEIIQPIERTSPKHRNNQSNIVRPTIGKLDKLRPTHPTASWTDQSNSPLGELDEPRLNPTRRWASWISLVQFTHRRVGSAHNHAFLLMYPSPRTSPRNQTSIKFRTF
ncbi:hypothetical protein YC2023_109304 [Brassica napus]